MRIVARSSSLSLIQANIVKDRINQVFPELIVKIIPIKTTGDIKTSIPLWQVEGVGFFTKELDDYILNGQADIAVHSMKDVGTERPEGIVTHGAIEREDSKDLLILNSHAIAKLKAQQFGKFDHPNDSTPIIIGTSSLRRAELLDRTFADIFPFDANFTIKHIRGNVETRVRNIGLATDYPKYCDAVIIATAGINRILNEEGKKGGGELRKFIDNQRLVSLPISIFPTSPAQGAICIETKDDNQEAVDVVKAIIDSSLTKEIYEERKFLRIFGGGCHQKFGASILKYRNYSSVIVRGKNKSNKDIDRNEDLSLPFDKELLQGLLRKYDLWDGRKYKKGIFIAHKLDYEYQIYKIKAKKFFVTHINALNSQVLLDFLKDKEVWTPGLTTLKKVKNLNVHVTGCCEGFGVEYLWENVTKNGLFSAKEEEVCILTSLNSAKINNYKNYLATYYNIIDNESQILKKAMDGIKDSKVGLFLWTDALQFKTFQEALEVEGKFSNSYHICMMGKTSQIIGKYISADKLITVPSFDYLQINIP